MIRHGWEHFPHGADVGIRGIGPTVADAFAQAAMALTAVTVDVGTVLPRALTELSCRAPTIELLLVDWLNALIYETATTGTLFVDFEVQIVGTDLHAFARGEPIEPNRHQPAVEVKGATQTELHVALRADGCWVAQCVVDV